jgi:hypothetical protein
VNDGSSDNTEVIARSFPVRCLNIRKHNRAAARNAGILSGAGDFVACIDADCVVDPDWLDESLRGFVSENIAAVQGNIRPAGTGVLAEYRRLVAQHCDQQHAHYHSVPTIAAAGVVFRRSALQHVGYFDESLSDYEDMDLSWKFLQAGYGFCFMPAATLDTCFDPPRISAYARRLFDKGRAAEKLFARWEQSFNLGKGALCSHCVNMRPISLRDTLRYCRKERKFSSLLSPFFGLSYRLGYSFSRRRRAPAALTEVLPGGYLPVSISNGAAKYDLSPTIRLIFDPESVVFFDFTGCLSRVGGGVERSFWICVLRGVVQGPALIAALTAEYEVEAAELRSWIEEYLGALLQFGILRTA